MSIADHFEQAPDARGIHGYGAIAARRQFHVSLALIAAFALVAVALGMALRFDAPTQHADIAAAFAPVAAPPAYAGRL